MSMLVMLRGYCDDGECVVAEGALSKGDDARSE
jgi:hypothetical protein